MGKNRYRKLYLSDLESEIKNHQGYQILKDLQETYYWDKIGDTIFNSKNLYLRKWNKPVKGTLLHRLTLPLFIITILLTLSIGGGIKWLFTGNSEILPHSSKIRNFFEKWSDKGGFDYI